MRRRVARPRHSPETAKCHPNYRFVLSSGIVATDSLARALQTTKSLCRLFELPSVGCDHLHYERQFMFRLFQHGIRDRVICSTGQMESPRPRAFVGSVFAALTSLVQLTAVL